MTGAHNPGNGCFKSLRKQPTFSDATTGFPAKWRLRSSERRNSILMTRHYPDLGRAFDWLKQRSHVPRQVTGRSTIQFWAQLFEGRLPLNPGLNLARVSFSFVQKHFLGQFSLIFIEHRIINLLTKIIKLNLLFKLSYLNSSFALTLGYLNPALNNPALGNDASSVRNFCNRFSDVISRGNQCWRREMSADFSGYCFKPLDFQMKKVHTGKSFVFVWPQSPHVRESRFHNPKRILLVESEIKLKDSGIPLRLESGIQFLQTTWNP